VFGAFLESWWPLPTSLDLVRGPIELVASTVLAEVSSFVPEERLACCWFPFDSISDIFASVSEFTNVPTVYFVLPTHSDWAVLWNNSFLCDGYDSLCWCLTNNHGMTTIHWQSSDRNAFFQAGSLFTARQRTLDGVAERSVYCCKNDVRWDFHVSGDSLPEEDTAAYTARRKRDRLDERRLMAFLARLGARPWEDSFYRRGNAFRIERVTYPSTISRRAFEEFACKRS
jgi:hypothetical protein